MVQVGVGDALHIRFGDVCEVLSLLRAKAEAQTVEFIERRGTGALIVGLFIELRRNHRQLFGALEFRVTDVARFGFVHVFENNVDDLLRPVRLGGGHDAKIARLQPQPIRGVHHIDELFAPQFRM